MANDLTNATVRCIRRGARVAITISGAFLDACVLTGEEVLWPDIPAARAGALSNRIDGYWIWQFDSDEKAQVFVTAHKAIIADVCTRLEWPNPYAKEE